jgi:hypothetical protein
MSQGCINDSVEGSVASSSLSRLFFIFICLLFTKFVFAYTVPTGVPTPIWGKIDPITVVPPQQPSKWPLAEAAKFYYIDNTSPYATDTNNTYGYPNKPRKTIPEISYAAGSYIEIHGGPYDGGGQIIFTANGTELSPVWVRGVGTQKALIRGEMISKGSYLFIENLAFDTDKKTLGLRTHSSSTLHHVSIRRCEFIGSGRNVGNGAAIAVYGSADKRFSDLVLYNNLIHDFGDKYAATENDYHGILVETNADRVWVLNNEIYNMGGDSIQVGIATTADTNRVNNIYVGNNTFHSDRENAVDIKEANNIVVSTNHLYDYHPVDSSDGTIVIIHNDSKNIKVLNNRIHSGTWGVVTTGALDTWISGNTIYDIHHSTENSNWTSGSLYADGAAIHFRGTSTGGVVNNIFYDYDIGIQLASGVKGYSLLSNYFDGTSQPMGGDLVFINATMSMNSKVDYNIFVSNTQNNKILIGGIAYSLGGYQTLNTCANCVLEAASLLSLEAAQVLSDSPQ